MTAYLVIARKINRHGECDFLTPSDEPAGLFTLAAKAAQRFATVQEAAAKILAVLEVTPAAKLSVMDMSEQEAGRPGFWTIADAWQERMQIPRELEHRKRAKAPQEFDLGALPLFGDQARQMDILDFLK